MCEDGVEPKHIHEGIETSVHQGHSLKEVFEILSMPDVIHLVQLLQDEVFVFHYIYGDQNFKD